MHKCLKCGYEYEGRFCPVCGDEWIADGNFCPKCGKSVPDGARFCSNCGARLDGKINCPACGTAVDEDSPYCYACGRKLSSPAQTYSAQRVKAVKKYDVKAILSIIGIACLMASVLFSLIFTFLSGVTPKAGTESQTQLLYAYFGDAYKDIDTVRETIKETFNYVAIGDVREFALLFPVIAGTVIAALGILGTVALSALSVWKVYQKFYKKADVNVAAPAIGAYLCYATMSTLLLMLVSTSSMGVSVRFSAPTFAGLIIGGIFCAAGALLFAGSHYDVFRNMDYVLGIIFSAVVSVLTVFVLAFVALPAGGVKIMNFTGSQLITVKTNYGLFTGMQSFIMITGVNETVNKGVAYATLGGCCAIAVAVLSAVTLFRKISSAANGKNKSNIILCACTAALAVVYLVCTVLFVNLMFEGSVADVKKNFAVTIVILIMSVLALGAEICGKFIRKSKSYRY